MLKKPKESQWLLLLCGWLLYLILFAVYILNASHEWVGGGLVPVGHWRLLPASSDAAGTMQAALRAIMFGAVFSVTVALRLKHQKVLVAAMLLAAAMVSIWTFYYRMVPRSVYHWTPLFVSRNQMAAYLCLMFPVALTSGARSQYKAFLAGRLSNPSGIWYLVAGLLGLSVIQTGSRAAIAVLVLQITGFIAIQWNIQRRHPFAVPPLSVLSRMMLGGALVLAIGLGGMSLVRHRHELGATGHDMGFRTVVRDDTMTMWTSRKWWGTGPGTFAAAFPYYQTLPLRELFFRHAHCEPAQFLAEFGVLGGGISLLALWLIMIGTARRKTRRQKRPSVKELECMGLLLALGGVMLHGLVDFPFRHPLILLVSAIWIGMIARSYGRLKDG